MYGMWVAKFKLKHNCILGNRCIKYNLTLQTVILNISKKGELVHTYSMNIMQGTKKEKKEFIESLKKDKNVIKIEESKDTFFLLEKQKSKAGGAYTQDVFFIKPVLIDDLGYEHWEVASLKKETLMRYINKTKKEMQEFRLLKITEEKTSDIFFPKLIPDLTPLQKEIIDIAIKKGYYEIPKKIDMRGLAKIKGISHSTFQEHLKKAEKKILPSLASYA